VFLWSWFILSFGPKGSAGCRKDCRSAGSIIGGIEWVSAFGYIPASEYKELYSDQDGTDADNVRGLVVFACGQLSDPLEDCSYNHRALFL
jgi:hypothetical protein